MKDILKHILRKLHLLEPIQRYRIRKKLQNNFEAEYKSLERSAQLTKPRFELSWANRKPYFFDRTSTTGFDRHYVYHPAWAARILSQTKPDFHIDISSTLHFCSIASAFVPIRFYDYRPAQLILDGLTTGHIDLTTLTWGDNTVHSLSCMHTVEHIGLGRYGDPIDYDGDLKAMHELSRVLAIDGNLLFVVPIGYKAQIIFNGHRIYTRDLVVESFPNLTLIDFTLIPEKQKDGGLVTNPSADLLSRQVYGCGCFWFTKKG